MLFSLPVFTLIHIVLSVLGIIAGLVVVGGLLAGTRLDGWTAFFLGTTIVTSVTGFGFPTRQVTPPQIVGVISLLVLGVCLAARYWKRLQGGWRSAYVISAVVALYLNVFVLVVQLFIKTPVLAQLAPTQTEPPFAVTQGLVLALFVWIGRSSLRAFKGADGARA